MSIIKIVLIGVAAVLLAIQFKQIKPEFGTYLSLAAGIVILWFACSQLKIIVDSINRIADYIDIDRKYIFILLKVIGIAYLCEFASNICKDSGYSTVASCIEMAGKLGIMVMSLPVVLSLLDTIQNFLK